MAAYWPYSLQMLFDNDGAPAIGARAYFFATDTLTPLTVYMDNGLVTPWGVSVQADGNGRMPAVYVDNSAAAAYRCRVDDVDGMNFQPLATIPMTVGTGAASAVDPASLMTTGMCHWTPLDMTMTGYVRLNGKTLGSASSGATERAAADTQALYQMLWAGLADAVCPVTGGRGATSIADFTANKQMGLPDLRGRAAFGNDAMGGANSNRIGGSWTPAGATTPGASGGVASILIGIPNLPPHTHPLGTFGAAAGANVVAQLNGASASGSTGGGVALSTISPGMVGTWLIKL